MQTTFRDELIEAQKARIKLLEEKVRELEAHIEALKTRRDVLERQLEEAKAILQGRVLEAERTWKDLAPSMDRVKELTKQVILDLAKNHPLGEVQNEQIVKEVKRRAPFEIGDNTVSARVRDLYADGWLRRVRLGVYVPQSPDTPPFPVERDRDG